MLCHTFCACHRRSQNLKFTTCSLECSPRTQILHFWKWKTGDFSYNTKSNYIQKVNEYLTRSRRLTGSRHPCSAEGQGRGCPSRCCPGWVDWPHPQGQLTVHWLYSGLPLLTPPSLGHVMGLGNLPMSNGGKFSNRPDSLNVSQYYGCFFPRDLVTSHFNFH